MSIPIPGPLVDFILLGPFDDRRQLQDSPILGDVWAEFGARPDERLELLIAPYRGVSAGKVASRINDELRKDKSLKKKDKEAPRISCVHGYIAADLKFLAMLRHVAPLTDWWTNQFGVKPAEDSNPSPPPAKLSEMPVRDRLQSLKVSTALEGIFGDAKNWFQTKLNDKMRETRAVLRFVALTGLILWAAKKSKPNVEGVDAQIRAILENSEQLAQEVAAELEIIAELPRGIKGESEYRVYSVSRNRKAMPALERSVGAVKADAARHLFKVRCHEIGWAVLDSGIDAEHPAFHDAEGKKSRVQGTYDFSHFRKMVSLSNTNDRACKKSANEIAENVPLEKELKPAEIKNYLKELALRAKDGGSVRWDLVEKLVEIKRDTPPPFSHGTHVAGIIGASAEGAKAYYKAKQEEKEKEKGSGAEAPVSKAEQQTPDESADGVCPDINLYDFRVLAPGLLDTEFAIIAALQFIRYLNQRDTFMTIHGANLSLSIPHNVRNYACGQTPICEECNRLSENGVVVVAAAGNHGYKSFTTNEGTFDGYAAFSITDPGNADDVITVGATHRYWPHTYGVSFFSSRGPTGDGRLKPDLVAPGEKIRAPLMHKEWGELDGTSMAAPHVSGAAAMLMARYSELVGRPRRIKQILCDTATDLGRERSFQGRGMLDVLRAFQSI